MTAPRPLPEIDAEAAPFWAGAARHQLLVQCCNACGNHQHYARPFCTSCRGRDLKMVPSYGTGVLHSFGCTPWPFRRAAHALYRGAGQTRRRAHAAESSG